MNSRLDESRERETTRRRASANDATEDDDIVVRIDRRARVGPVSCTRLATSEKMNRLDTSDVRDVGDTPRRTSSDRDGQQTSRATT